MQNFIHTKRGKNATTVKPTKPQAPGKVEYDKTIKALNEEIRDAKEDIRTLKVLKKQAKLTYKLSTMTMRAK